MYPEHQSFLTEQNFEAKWQGQERVFHIARRQRMIQE
jgi:hypothetical protein